MNVAYDKLIELFNRLLEEADDKMLWLITGKEVKDIYLSAPDIIITHLTDALTLRYNLKLTNQDVSNHLIFRGLTVYPSSDWAITLYHKNYTLYKEDWMIRKIPLYTPQAIKKEWYTEYIVSLTDIITLPPVAVSNN